MDKNNCTIYCQGYGVKFLFTMRKSENLYLHFEKLLLSTNDKINTFYVLPIVFTPGKPKSPREICAYITKI